MLRFFVKHSSKVLNYMSTHLFRQSIQIIIGVFFRVVFFYLQRNSNQQVNVHPGPKSLIT